MNLEYVLGNFAILCWVTYGSYLLLKRFLKKRTVEYFVSYYWVSSEEEGRGQISVTLSHKIDSIDAINLIKEWLDDNIKDKKGNTCRCIVQNWKRYE